MSYTPATEKLIRALQQLPGVGVRSAQRMALQLLERNPEAAQNLQQALLVAIEKVHKCPTCRTLTEHDECDTCSNTLREQNVLCVVANDADRAGIEMSGKFNGRYFVLHGVLSPIDGIGPEELGIFQLVERVKQGQITEVILALDAQMEAEATVHYIGEHLKQTDVKISRVHFQQMKSGALDQTESHIIGNALAQKQEIGFEHD